MFAVGSKVHYIPFWSAHESTYENGIVKSLCEDPEYVFVVYKCKGDWDNYKEYTGVRTPVDMLKENWIEIDPNC